MLSVITFNLRRCQYNSPKKKNEETASNTATTSFAKTSSQPPLPLVLHSHNSSSLNPYPCTPFPSIAPPTVTAANSGGERDNGWCWQWQLRMADWEWSGWAMKAMRLSGTVALEQSCLWTVVCGWLVTMSGLWLIKAEKRRRRKKKLLQVCNEMLSGGGIVDAFEVSWAHRHWWKRGHRRREKKCG